MDSERFSRISLEGVETPCFILDEGLLEENLKILDLVQKKTGCRILLALKGFAMFSTFPLIRKYLHGVCAGSLHEARLGFEEFGREVHTYAPAFRDSEIGEVIKYSDHIVFNSFSQLRRFAPAIEKARAAGKKIEVGIRINPEHGEAPSEHYNPCGAGSRFGIHVEELHGQSLEGIRGLHFHALCEKYSDSLERVLDVVNEKFGKYIRKMRWVNFGGGHLITDKGYDVEHLCRLINDFRDRYPNIEQVYLEPGEAVAFNAGILVTTVLDVKSGREGNAAILDFSPEAHLSDIIVSPFRQEILGAGMPGEHPHKYLLGAPTCSAGDVLGEYSFFKPLKVGDRLILLNMAVYSMVKTSNFCGVRLPDIAIYHPKTGDVEVVRKFGYEDFKNRLS